MADTRHPNPVVALFRRMRPTPTPSTQPHLAATTVGPAHVVPARLGAMGDDLLAVEASTPAEALAGRFLQVAETGFVEDYEPILADDVVYLVPGRSRVAGLHRGRAAVVAALTPPPQDPATTAITRCEATELLATEDRAVVILRLDGVADGIPFSSESAFHLQVRGGRIVAITEYAGDQYRIDRVIG